MDIQPIRNDEDHRAALGEIEALWGAAPDTPEGDRLDVLATLVEAYEAQRWPLDDPDPIELIEFAIAERGHSQAELGRLLGSRARASEVLSRKRPLTMAMVHKLNVEWGIPAGLLIKPYRLERVKLPRPGALQGSPGKQRQSAK